MARRLEFRLAGGLTDAELAQVHRQVLRALGQVGLEVSHQRSRRAAASHPGVAAKGDRLHLDPDLVEEFVERARRDHPAEPPGPEVTVSGPWNCLNIADPETDEIRPSTLADCRRMFRLVQAAGAGGICPVYPNDAPPRLQVPALEKAGLELTDGHGSLLAFPDPEMLEFTAAMYRAAGRVLHVDAQLAISPLKTNPEGLEAVWRYRDRDDLRLRACAAPIPQAGATAPLFLPGGLVQAAAEALGCYILVQLITDGTVDCLPQYRLDCFDLKTTVTVYSSPRHILYQLALKDLYEFYYGTPKPGHFLQSLAPRCNAQAVLERTAYMLTLALAGMRRFCLGAGQLCRDQVFSPVMFVVDREIARFVTHLVRGVDYEGEVDAAEAIAEGVREDGFWIHEKTLEHMRDGFESDLFPRLSLDAWRAAGEPSARQTAKECVEELIESHDFSLTDRVQAEIDEIYRRAVQAAD
jgi:trimethylamine--corrinoid protein Co-methyltransferase